MIPIVETKIEAIKALCGRYRVRRFEIFGSAATGEDFKKGRSDFDFLVEFERSGAIAPSDQYFGLLEDLEKLFGRRVDLVEVKAMSNPYLIKSINATRRLIWAA